MHGSVVSQREIVFRESVGIDFTFGYHVMLCVCVCIHNNISSNCAIKGVRVCVCVRVCVSAHTLIQSQSYTCLRSRIKACFLREEKSSVVARLHVYLALIQSMECRENVKALDR